MHNSLTRDDAERLQAIFRGAAPEATEQDQRIAVFLTAAVRKAAMGDVTVVPEAQLDDLVIEANKRDSFAARFRHLAGMEFKRDCAKRTK